MYLAPSIPGRSRSSRVKARYCGQVSAWIGRPEACARATRSAPSGVETWTMKSPAPTSRASEIARLIASASASAGREIA